MKLLATIALALVLAGCGNDQPSEDQIKAVIEPSDDAEMYSEEFREATLKISEIKSCDIESMIENAGFWKVPEIKNTPVYFIYCSLPMHSSNRYYLNVDTGVISQSKSSVY